MPQTLTINPVTRIEGHLGIRIEVNNGSVSAAYSSGESYRGFEQILVNRDPLDAQHITQRICGVCPIEHGVASNLAQEMAFGAQPTANGRLPRNIIAASYFIQFHILRFYTLSAVDFIDVTAVLDYQGSDAGLVYLKSWVQNELARCCPAWPAGQPKPPPRPSQRTRTRLLGGEQTRTTDRPVAGRVAPSRYWGICRVAGCFPRQQPCLRILSPVDLVLSPGRSRGCRSVA